MTKLCCSCDAFSYASFQFQLSNDPFMKQVQYGSQLVSLITNTNKNPNDDGSNNANTDETIVSSLIAQLSHSDGIRGFMVSFLTRESENGNDQEEDSEEIIPSPLLEALSQVNNSEDLASLACEFKKH